MFISASAVHGVIDSVNDVADVMPVMGECSTHGSVIDLNVTVDDVVNEGMIGVQVDMNGLDNRMESAVSDTSNR